MFKKIIIQRILGSHLILHRDADIRLKNLPKPVQKLHISRIHRVAALDDGNPSALCIADIQCLGNAVK